MQCPVCDVPLSISSREGVEIDFCPQCRGVWLDRGELDKVIERASTMVGGAAPEVDDRRPPPRYDERRGYDRDYDRGRDRPYDDRGRYDDDYRYGRKKKRRGFLDDLFDFD